MVGWAGTYFLIQIENTPRPNRPRPAADLSVGPVCYGMNGSGWLPMGVVHRVQSLPSCVRVPVEPTRGYYVTTRGCAIESSILCHSHDPTFYCRAKSVIMCVRSKTNAHAYVRELGFSIKQCQVLQEQILLHFAVIVAFSKNCV